jgi:hypothetical protein
MYGDAGVVFTMAITLGRGGATPSGHLLVGLKVLLPELLGPVPGSPGCWMERKSVVSSGVNSRTQSRHRRPVYQSS